MKSLSLLSLLLGTAILVLPSAAAFANTDPTIPSLADGDYFYGEAPIANEAGAGYLVFRKTGTRVSGLFYQQGTNFSFCWQGKSMLNLSKNSVKEVMPIEFPSLGGLFKLEFNQLPEPIAKNFQECVR